ncbi:hypothetical protein RSAG8_05469, partial [Rhizoctonia solani AG-8 WAC10335]
MIIHPPPINDDAEMGCTNYVTLSPNRTRIAICLNLGILSMYDTHSERLLYAPFTIPAHQARSVEYSPDNTRIVYKNESHLLVKDVQSGEKAFVKGHEKSWVGSVQFFPYGSRIISSSADGCRRSSRSTVIQPSQMAFRQRNVFETLQMVPGSCLAWKTGQFERLIFNSLRGTRLLDPHPGSLGSGDERRWVGGRRQSC